MSHTLINCTCKNRLWYHSILRGSIDQKHAKTNKIWRQNSEIHPAFACSRWPPWFPDLSRPYGACVKRGSGKHVRSQSFSSESAVKYLHVGRRKIQISPPLGEQDQSNALPQGQQRQSNPPRRHNIDRCITKMQGNLENASKCRHQVTPMLINWAPIFYNSIECWTRYYQYPMKQNWQRVSILYWAS